MSSHPTDMRAAKGDISESRILSTRLEQNLLLDYAVTHSGDHARGKPEEIIEKQIFEFLDVSGPMESFLRTQYRGLNCGGLQYASDRSLTASAPLSLHVAVWLRLKHIVKLLIKETIPTQIYGLDQRGETALYWAVMSGSGSLALVLMQRGVDIDEQMKAEHTEAYQGTTMGFGKWLELADIKKEKTATRRR